MATPSSVSPAHYQLSTELVGHSGDVRCVLGFRVENSESDFVLTASRDKTARLWERNGRRDFKLVKIFQQHTGFVSAACIIPVDRKAGRDKR